MQDNTLLLVAGVGLALVCVGVIVVGGLMLLRIIGAGSIPLFGALLGGGDDEHRRMVRPAPKPDLRSIAQSASGDFDAALARHDAQTAAPPAAAQTIISAPPAPLSPNPTFSAPPVPTSADPFPPAPPRLGSRRDRTRPNIDEDDDDDLLGAVLDEDEL